MSAHFVRYLDAEGVERVADFADAREAWAFMRLCDAHGVRAGYPEWDMARRPA